ncbi:MAG: tetratricopeptide repeat protein [Sandaracinaceae bacterium]
MRVRWAVRSLLFSFLTLLTVPAVAQDARELFQQGEAAYQTGDYTEAATLWERAYEMDARPLLQHNLAQAYERLGQLDRAAAAYQIYIDASPPDDARSVTARARLASLRERLGNTGIQLTGGPEGATILIDGQDRGRLPHPDPLRLEPGSHQVVIRLDGYSDFTSVVAVSAGQAAEVPVSMQAGESGTASVGGGGGGGISMIGLAIALGGAAVLVGGAVTGGLALSAADGAPATEGPEADEARTLALVTDILIPTGAVIAAAGVVLMFVLDDGGSSDSARVVPVLGPDYAGVSVSGAL